MVLFELSWHPTLSLHLCPSLRQWHMDCVNSWAAGQPQIRYEYTAHEAQLFKTVSPIAHTSYTTSCANILIIQTSSVCGYLKDYFPLNVYSIVTDRFTLQVT